MSDQDVVQEIVAPLLARHGAGKAAIVVVTHAGDEVPAQLMGAVEEAIREAGPKILRIGFAELAPNPVRGFVRLARRGGETFSVVIEPEVLADSSGELITALNLHRNTYAREGLCAIFWIPTWGLRAFTDRASNFLDFRTRLLEVDLDGQLLEANAVSPRFFVPRPPPPDFFERHRADIDRLKDLLSSHDRVAVVGHDYHGWPGGPGTLVKATLYRERQKHVDAGGAFWIDGASDRWLDRLMELAPKLGVEGDSHEVRIEGIASYLQAHPGALIVYDGVREPDALRTTLVEGQSVLDLGGKVLVTTPRRDLSSRDFSASLVIEAEKSMPEGPGHSRQLKLLRTLQTQGEPTALDWSPDGRWLAAIHSGTVLIYEADQGTLARRLVSPVSPLTSLAWSPNGRELAAGSFHGKLAIWVLETGTISWSDRDHGGTIWSLAWSPDGRSLASASADRTAGIWRSQGATARLSKILEGHRQDVSSVTWSPDASRLATGSLDGSVRIWDSGSGALHRLIEAHSAEVLDVDWSPDGKKLLSASVDRTLRVWSFESGLQEAVLEGHVGAVASAAFSHDGRIIASCDSLDVPIVESQLIWRCDTYELLASMHSEDEPAAEAESHEDDRFVGKPALVHPFFFPIKVPLAVHPNNLQLAIYSSKVHEVRIWRLDFDLRLGSPLAAVSARYANAKVVLVGDTGVGKSGLSLVLSGQSFRPTESTHGRRVRTFARRQVDLPGHGRETRETLLWDLAGQAGYRLVHQLQLGEVAVALVVFDARSETDPFAGIRYWDRALRQAQRARGDAAVPMKRILVAARADRGSVPVGRRQIDALIRELGFDAYFETSAKEGWGVANVAAAIDAAIDWDALPQVRSSELFSDIKDFLLEARETGRLIATVEELLKAFLESGRAPESRELPAQFETCIGLVESRDLIRRLSFGDLILLQPELLDAYASAMVDTARKEPDGLGSLDEGAAIAGDFRLSVDQRLEDPDAERILLTATVEELLRHEIALRESTPTGALLVFPSQFTRDWPEAPDPEGQETIFEFHGPVLSVYTTLIVRLTRSGRFSKQELWRNAARFGAHAGGACGVWLQEVEEGHGRLTLFYSPDTSEETRSQFEEYILVHLKRRALPESLERRRIFTCPACRTPLTDLIVRRRLKRGFKWVACPVCETRISLEERLEDATIDSVILAIDRSADAGRNRDTSAAVLRGKKVTGDFDLFLAHDPADHTTVEDLASKLETRGIHSWLELEPTSPSRWFEDVIEQHLQRVRSVAIAIGIGSLQVWHIDDVRSFIDRCVERRFAVILFTLPGIGQLTPDWLSLSTLPGVNFVTNTEDAKMLDWLEFRLTGRRPPSGGI